MAGPRKKPRQTERKVYPGLWDTDFPRTMIYRRELLRDPEADTDDLTYVYVADMANTYAERYGGHPRDYLRAIRAAVANHHYGQPLERS